MARVSIQYAMHQELSTHDEKQIKRELDTFPGVKSVALNLESGLLCVDYDDTGVDQHSLEQRLHELGYSLVLVDKLTF